MRSIAIRALMIAAVTLVALSPMTAVAEWACVETSGCPETSHCFNYVDGHIVGVKILVNYDTCQ